jgi:hypothetical protein
VSPTSRGDLKHDVCGQIDGSHATSRRNFEQSLHEVKQAVQKLKYWKRVLFTKQIIYK